MTVHQLDYTIPTDINPFQYSVTFLYPLKTSGVQKWDTGVKWVKELLVDGDVINGMEYKYGNEGMSDNQQDEL